MCTSRTHWTKSLLIGLIVCAAAAVRMLPASYGLPYQYHCDEPEVVQGALRMMKSGDLNPHSFTYPSLYKYIQLIVSIAYYHHAMGHGIMTSLGDLVTADEAGWYWYIHIPSFNLWARIVTALFGAFTVYVIYRIGEEWGNYCFVDPRVTMTNWIAENLPRDARIVFVRELRFHEPSLKKNGARLLYHGATRNLGRISQRAQDHASGNLGLVQV